MAHCIQCKSDLLFCGGEDYIDHWYCKKCDEAFDLDEVVE